ncbi:lipocalin-like protein [Burkholderia sp. GAS332]|nr:lipocalin-like protein [Burkholderia sp. GAS332]
MTLDSGGNLAGDSRQSTCAGYWEGAARMGRVGADVGRTYLELTGYGNTIRIGKE